MQANLFLELESDDPIQDDSFSHNSVPGSDDPLKQPEQKLSDSELHGSELHGPELHGPELHSPELHSPELHSPELHSPELHSPELHGPELHGPELHGPELHDSQLHNLNSLMQKGGLWRASSIGSGFRQGLPTGFSKLDHYLPGSGWPQDGVTELLYEQSGIGEIRLLAPALARLSKEMSKQILFVAPPHIPYPPALDAMGIDLKMLLVVRPRTPNDMLWILEQALGSKSCSAVLAWPGTILEKQIRRLQVASKEGSAWNILFRPLQAMSQSSPAELRIRLSAGSYAPLSAHTSINLQILKRRGGWETDIINLHFEDNLNLRTPDFSELLRTNLHI